MTEFITRDYGSNESSLFNFYYDYLSDAVSIMNDDDDIASKLSRIFYVACVLGGRGINCLIGKYSIDDVVYMVFYNRDTGVMVKMRIVGAFYPISGNPNNKMMVAVVFTDEAFGVARRKTADNFAILNYFAERFDKRIAVTRTCR